MSEAARWADRTAAIICFGCAVFASALIGRAACMRFERGMSVRIPEIFNAGGADAERAQRLYSYTIKEGRDAATAFTLLTSGKVTSGGAQEMLAETVARHGSQEQAVRLLDGGAVSGFAAGALRSKAGRESI